MQALLPFPALPPECPEELTHRRSKYRPISMLPAFSKLFDKVMFNRLTEFLNLHNTLYSKQFVFLNNHSSTLALIDLISNISLAIDRNESTSGIFLDLSNCLIPLIIKYCATNCNTMVFRTLPCRGSKGLI